MRRLSLHASALNDEEYKLFTDSILDLAISDAGPSASAADPRDDAFYEAITVSVREVRAWLRGRYPNIPVASIDTILKFFSPALGQGDTLTGGQFFAALRLVVHVQHGKEADRALAFVQAHPPSSPASASLKPPPTLPQSPTRAEGAHPSSTISEPGLPQANPFSYEPRHQPPLHPSHRQELNNTPHSPHNPFLAQKKPISARSEDGSGKIPPLPPRKPPILAPPPRHAAVSSPPLPRPQLHPNSYSRAPPTAAPHAPPVPPIPPKPKASTHITSTLIKQSLQASKAAQTMKKAEEELEKERVLQVLRSSAIISGSNLRGPYGSRSPTKRAPVAKSDSSASWSGEDGRERPPLPRRRHQHQQQPSPPMSVSSLEQVALAVAPSGSKTRTPYSSSPFDSPDTSPRSRTVPELPGVAGLPPPTHPDRKPYHTPSTLTDEPSPFKRNLESFEAAYGSVRLTSESTPATAMSMETPTTPTAADISGSGSPSSRMYRSKSLHYHSHPPPPPPPARHRRPESVQLVSNGEVLFGSKYGNPSVVNGLPLNNGPKSPMTHGSESGPHRRSSLSGGLSGGGNSDVGGGRAAGGTESIQRTLAGLQLRAESALPKLEAARYKAEAGLSRRGFIKGEGRAWSRSGREDRENLMSREYYGDDRDEEDGEERGVGVDSGDEGGHGRGRSGARERDDLKWPAGEGWRML